MSLWLRFCADSCDSNQLRLFETFRLRIFNVHVPSRLTTATVSLPLRPKVLPFDQVIEYGTGKRLGIVSYGNGVVASLRVREQLKCEGVDDVCNSIALCSAVAPFAGVSLGIALSGHS